MDQRSGRVEHGEAEQDIGGKPMPFRDLVSPSAVADLRQTDDRTGFRLDQTATFADPFGIQSAVWPMIQRTVTDAAVTQ